MGRVGLSIDVDSVASHLAGYGISGAPQDDVALDVAVPRLLALLDHAGARSTFFLIAADARRRPDVVRDIVAAGHEVASHSLTHPVPFSRLAPQDLRAEVRDSRHLLEDLTGLEVRGFRAPGFDADATVLDAVAEAGYDYDASSYPSWFALLMRGAVRKRGASGAANGRLDLRGSVAPTRIHTASTSHGGIVQVPLGVTPILRIPHYHTLRLILGSRVFARLTRRARTRSRSVTYCLHAVDVLDLEADDLDPRLHRHPGMGLRLADKLGRLSDALDDLNQTGTVVPIAELVDAELPGVAGAHAITRLPPS